MCDFLGVVECLSAALSRGLSLFCGRCNDNPPRDSRLRDPARNESLGVSRSASGILQREDAGNGRTQARSCARARARAYVGSVLLSGDLFLIERPIVSGTSTMTRRDQRAPRSFCCRIASDRMRFLRNRSGTESPRSLDSSMRNRQVSSPLRRTGDVSLCLRPFYRVLPTLASDLSGVPRSVFIQHAIGKRRFALTIPFFPFAGAVSVPGFRRRSEPEDRPRDVSAHVPGHRLPKDDAAETQTSPSGGTSASRFSLREISLHVAFDLVS